VDTIWASVLYGVTINIGPLAGAIARTHGNRYAAGVKWYVEYAVPLTTLLPIRVDADVRAGAVDV
jgi:hypothetical protein